MGSKRFRDLNDFVRHGQNLDLQCRNGHCAHRGIVGAWEAATWFRLHRYGTSLEGFMGSALDHFRCSRCGDRPVSIRPTENAPTVVDFFPVGEKGWAMLARRLRG